MIPCSKKITLARQLGGTNWILFSISRTLLRVLTPACIYCNEVDRRSEECALSSRPPSSGPSSGPTVTRDWLHPQGRLTCSTPYNRAPPPSSSRTAICSSWNRGRCAFLGTCNFRHVCVLCLGNQHARPCSNGGRGPSPKTPRPPVVTSSSVHR